MAMEAENYIALGTAFLGLSGLGFGLYQYYVAQKWKRSEFAAKHLEQLATDPELSLLCKLLDWNKRHLPVPEKYRPLTKSPVFEHNWEVFAAAMIAHGRKGDYSWQEAMYRDLVDRFCEYLQSLNHYVTIGLIDLRDISTIKYWLRELARPRFASTRDEQMFLDFIKVFAYPGVFKLMDRFGVDRPDRRPPRAEPGAALGPAGR